MYNKLRTTNYEIVDASGRVVGTVRTDSAERALAVHCAALSVSPKGLTVRIAQEFV